MKRLSLSIEGMHCDGCSNRLTKVLQGLDGVTSASVSFETKKAELEIDENVIDEEEINNAIVDAGFEVLEV